MTDQQDRLAYKATLLRTLASDGVAVIATFGPNAPERCSGLPTVRYSSDLLAREFGDDLVLTADRLELHRTPKGETQEFVYCAFTRRERRRMAFDEGLAQRLREAPRFPSEHRRKEDVRWPRFHVARLHVPGGCGRRDDG